VGILRSHDLRELDRLLMELLATVFTH
jgi:hypothetical protein